MYECFEQENSSDNKYRHRLCRVIIVYCFRQEVYFYKR